MAESKGGWHFIVHPAAQKEIEASVNWYLERSYRAAENFVLAIEQTIDLICSHPYRWRNEYRNYYELGLKDYPFTIIYTINDENKFIAIVAVYHQKRKTQGKYRRLNPGTKK